MCPTACEWKTKKMRGVKTTEIFQVENGKVEAIYIRDFRFFVKCEVLHSSTETLK